MAEEKKKVPEHIEKYYKHTEKARRLIETTEHHHRGAYNSAVDKLLLNEAGEVDYDKLKDTKVQTGFADHMADFYLDKAISYFGLKKEDEKLTKEIKGDVFKKDMMIKAYANTTQDELRNLTRQYQDKFKYDVFDKAKDEWMKEVAQRLMNTASSHITKDHLEDIVNYTGAGDLVDKDRLLREHGLMLLNLHKDYGKIPDNEKVLEEAFSRFPLGYGAIKKKQEKKKK